MIQTGKIRAAGVPEQDIRQLEAAWEAFQNAKNHALHQTPHIACTGIYNAGKSTLLNALAGEELFPTGDVPTTRKVAQAEFGGAVYIDTPGLNAAEEDDLETQTAYETADFILFVSSAQNGGISEAEAAWLQTLKARYSSLQQRLIFVLTHCTQVEQAQLPAIREQFRKDFFKAVEFEPEEILCVDSITYQRGKREDKAALVEHSGILQLQTCLAKRIVEAEKTLREAQEAELAAQRKAVQEQIGRISDTIQADVDKAGRAGREKIAQVDRAWAGLENALQKAMPVEEPGFVWPESVSFGWDTIEVRGERSESAAKSKLKNKLQRYYDKRERAARDAVLHDISDVKKNYCSTGPDGTYARCCSEINTAFDTCILALQKLGGSMSPGAGVAVVPDLPSDLGYQVEQQLTDDLVPYGDCYSLSSYVIYADVSCIMEYERGMFGIERAVERYYIYNGHHAVREMEKDLNGRIETNVKYTRSFLMGYWRKFRENLVAATNNRKAALKKQVDDYKATLSQSAVPSGAQAAQSYLESLKREVSQ